MRWLHLAILFLTSIVAFSIFLRHLPFPNVNLPPLLSPPKSAASSQAILFTGDVFLGRAVERWWHRTPTNDPFKNLTELFRTYESVVVNFESAIPKTHQPTPDYGWRFSVPSSTVALLERAGVMTVSLANNHTYDFGAAELTHTRDVFAAYGIHAFGHPNQTSSEVHIATIDGTTIALVGYNHTTVALDVAAATEQLRDVAARYDLVVVYIHWGTEYESTPTTAQTELATKLAAAGADLIIGHHPHVVQTIDYIDNTLVVYSLGNTIFDQYFSDAVQQGLLVGLGQRSGAWGITLYPISSRASWHQPTIATSAEHAAILDVLAHDATPELAASIATGWVPLRTR